MTDRTPPLSLLAHPYTSLAPHTGGRDALRSAARDPGSALVWSMGSGRHSSVVDMVARRPGGLALLAILPRAAEIGSDPHVMQAIQVVRPHGVLPFHVSPSAPELSLVLKRPPADLAGEITDYLRWRGIGMDIDTAHVVRRIIDLSAELRSISAVSRSMYLSRRALGRRLMSRGLPVPSHWLQMGRLLRVALRLQNSDATVSTAAYELGYPDGFSVSNQMERLVGHRPIEVRERLGWEWLLENWLRREAENGGLAPSIANRLREQGAQRSAGPLAPQKRNPARTRGAREPAG